MKIQDLRLFVFLLSGFVVSMGFAQNPPATAGDVVTEVIEKAAKESSSQTPSPYESKPMGQMMDEAMRTIAKNQSDPSKEKSQTGLANSHVASSNTTGAGMGDDEYWCQKLLKSSIAKYLPEGYSNPQTSLIEMTPAERAGRMHCKFSVVSHGPASFNAIRYRIYESNGAADRGFDSLRKELPADIKVIAGNLGYQHDLKSRYQVPCMAFTTGKRDLTFVSCADQLEDTVISGVSSQPYTGNSIDTDTTSRAGKLLEAGIAALRGLASEGVDDLWKKVFEKDQKK